MPGHYLAHPDQVVAHVRIGAGPVAVPLDDDHVGGGPGEQVVEQFEHLRVHRMGVAVDPFAVAEHASGQVDVADPVRRYRVDELHRVNVPVPGVDPDVGQVQQAVPFVGFV